jgi:hypothetical protein
MRVQFDVLAYSCHIPGIVLRVAVDYLWATKECREEKKKRWTDSITRARILHVIFNKPAAAAWEPNDWLLWARSAVGLRQHDVIRVRAVFFSVIVPHSVQKPDKKTECWAKAITRDRRTSSRDEACIPMISYAWSKSDTRSCAVLCCCVNIQYNHSLGRLITVSFFFIANEE